MFKRVLFRGTVFIGGFIATIKMLDKIEEADKKRKEAKAKKENSKEVKKELTEEEVVDAMYNMHRDII
jgi:hypothetical protein